MVWAEETRSCLRLHRTSLPRDLVHFPLRVVAHEVTCCDVVLDRDGHESVVGVEAKDGRVRDGERLELLHREKGSLKERELSEIGSSPTEITQWYKTDVKFLVRTKEL